MKSVILITAVLLSSCVQRDPFDNMVDSVHPYEDVITQYPDVTNNPAFNPVGYQ